jgi:hypothetical protein
MREVVPDHFPFAVESGIAVMPRLRGHGYCQICKYEEFCRQVVSREGLALCESIFEWELLPDAIRIIIEENSQDLMDVVWDVGCGVSSWCKVYYGSRAKT